MKFILIYSCILICTINLYGFWANLDHSIFGLGQEDFGDSVSISDDGKRFAIGSYSGHESYGLAYGFSDANGAVKVFEFQNGEWIKIGQNLVGTNYGSKFGDSVSLNSVGNILAVGSPMHNTSWGNNVGQVKVFEFISFGAEGFWVQKGSSLIGDFNSSSPAIRFGNHVCLSSDGLTLASSAPDYRMGTFSQNGQVKVFRFEMDDWVALGQVLYGIQDDERIGQSLALSADGKVLAYAYDEESFFTKGGVRIYKLINDEWIQQGLDIIGQEVSDYLGIGWGPNSNSSAISLNSDGTIIAIGAWGSDINGNLSGQVSILEFINGTWTLKGDYINGDSGSYFGASVSINDRGDLVAVGAPQKDETKSNIGSIRVFKFSDNQWNPYGQEIYGHYDFDYLGQNVSISGDGTTLIAGITGADNHEIIAGHEAGTFKVFRFINDGMNYLSLSSDIEVSNGQATVQLQMEESSDLQTWEDTGTPATMTVPADTDTKFFRFKMSE